MTEKKVQAAKRVPLPEEFRKSLGIKLPTGNPMLFAKKDADVEKLPSSLRPLSLSGSPLEPKASRSTKSFAAIAEHAGIAASF
ncbi:MAG: hypothetical protein DMG30_15805 [Acidobacteria bacterium]|nr:MAG: hypothetical protein DMG30_15805 [Acidobacteriota bacterium]